MAEKITEQLQTIKRGAVEVYTEAELSEKLVQAKKEGRQLRIKLGLDPTSTDIHLGHTVVLRKMRQFQDIGHKAVLIIGDYTARIGDPSGQNTTRPMLTGEQIEANAKTYFGQAGKVLDTSEQKLEVRYNSEWLREMDLADIIKLAANMTVARMLERDTFEIRHKKEEAIGIHEFLYPLMQGYDSVMIQSDVELGGTDQTFNNLVGRDLQRVYGQKPQVVMTMPILVGLDGKEKMSKSKGNYIGITDEPTEMFGKIMSISDEMMENYFTLLTDTGTQRIAELTDSSRTHPKEAKVLLGKMLVARFYDEGAAEAAAVEFENVFGKGGLPDEIQTVEIPAVDTPANMTSLVTFAGLADTKSEAKRKIKQNALKINGKKKSNPNEQPELKNDMIIKYGREYRKVKLTD